MEQHQKQYINTKYQKDIKALSRNIKNDGKIYSVHNTLHIQLEICMANVNPDGTLKVAGFSRMSKEDILKFEDLKRC